MEITEANKFQILQNRNIRKRDLLDSLQNCQKQLQDWKKRCESWQVRASNTEKKNDESERKITKLINILENTTCK